MPAPTASECRACLAMVLPHCHALCQVLLAGDKVYEWFWMCVCHGNQSCYCYNVQDCTPQWHRAGRPEGVGRCGIAKGGGACTRIGQGKRRPRRARPKPRPTPPLPGARHLRRLSRCPIRINDETVAQGLPASKLMMISQSASGCWHCWPAGQILPDGCTLHSTF